MAQPLGFNDLVLFASLLYSCVDVLCEWAMFDACARPIHQWLLVSYGCVISFRLAHVFACMRAAAAAPRGAAGAGSGADFLLDLRHKDVTPRLLASFTWAMALPFFILWTLLGTHWLWRVATDTPECASSAHLWFSGLWLALCYVWIVIHTALAGVAWVLERRLQRAESDLRVIEDDDVISRWGQVSSLSGYDALLGSMGKGLTPAQIRSLPTSVQEEEVELGEEQRECPICITELRPGDSVRCLPGCEHAFHRSCIDLWLLRRADCPLCKRDVRRDIAEA